MKKKINIAIVGLGQIGGYLLKEINGFPIHQVGIGKINSAMNMMNLNF